MDRKLLLANSNRSEVIKTEERIYYNVVIANNTQQPIQAKFNEVRNEGIVPIPENYSLIVTRFIVGTQTVPIFFMPIAPFPNLNPDLSTLSITLTYSGIDFQVFLIYSALNSFSPPNPPTVDNPDWEFAPYYGVFSFQQLLDMLNTALATAFTALKFFFPLAPPTQAPYFTFDPVTELISLFCQQLYDPVVAGAPTIEIWLDSEMYSFFENFETFFAGYDQLAGKDYQFVIKNNNNNIPASPMAYYEFKQEYRTLYNWTSFRNIVFLTGNVPVKYEYIPITNNLGSQVGDNYLPILTDFQAVDTSPSDYRGYVQYIPSGEYRRTDLKGTEPLKTFDISVFWEDKLGNLFPLLVPPLDSISIKMLFEHKGCRKYL